MLFSLLLLCWVSHSVCASRSWSKQIELETKECNSTKFCMMRPHGCHPSKDCTQGYMLSVVGPNQLKVEMFAQSLVPSVPLQFLAVGFSKDQAMGNDMVSECVVSETAIEGGELFLSFNGDKNNDRILLDELEAEVVFSDVQSSVVDGRISCSFIQSIRPEIESGHENRIIDLDEHLFILGATGSAQPDEVNAHDLNRESHFFPLVSHEAVNPAKIGNKEFVHPDSRLKSRKQQPRVPSRLPVGSCSAMISLVTVILPLVHFLL